MCTNLYASISKQNITTHTLIHPHKPGFKVAVTLLLLSHLDEMGYEFQSFASLGREMALWMDRSEEAKAQVYT